MEFRKRILYVDDHQGPREPVQSILPPCCYEVVMSGTATDALGLAQRLAFDLYILDSNIDLCRQLRAKAPETPILFYSSAASELDPNEALEAGAQCHLLKPAKPWDLEQAVVDLIQKTQSEKRAGHGRKAS